MSHHEEIVVFGATGYTGRLIARRLDSAGIPFTIAARDSRRAAALQADLATRPPVTRVDFADRAEVTGAVTGPRIVINCVGPYSLFGELVLEECRAREVIYIDLSGEQEFIRRSMEAGARNGGPSTILHSIAFESALADLLAHEMLDPAVGYSSISTFYSFAKSRPSPGTLLTMKLAPLLPTFRVSQGKIVRAAPLGFEHDVPVEASKESVAVFMPFPEVLFFHDRYRPEESGSFLLMPGMEAAFARAARGRSTPDLNTLLKQHRRSTRAGPSAIERSQQEFTLTLCAVERGGRRHTQRLAGRDMYGITAALVLHVVEAVRAGARLPTGTPAPSEIPVWDGILERLEDEAFLSPAEALR